MRARTLGGYAGEIVVVVLGILIAFAVDAGWDAYRERREEREILEALERDFRESVERAEGFALPLHVSTLSASEEMLWRLRRPGEPYPRLGQASPTEGVERVLVGLGREGRPASVPAVEVPDSLIGVTLYAGTSDLTFASLDALLAAGGIERIRNRELRALLASFPAELADVQDEEFLTRDLVVGDYRRALRAAGDPVIAELGDPWLDFGQPFAIPDTLRRRVTTLRATDELAAVLAARIQLDGGATGELSDLIVLMRDILSLLEEELAR